MTVPSLAVKVPSALAIGDFHPNSQTLLPKDFRSCQNAALQWVKINSFLDEEKPNIEPSLKLTVRP